MPSDLKDDKPMGSQNWAGYLAKGKTALCSYSLLQATVAPVLQTKEWAGLSFAERMKGGGENQTAIDLQLAWLPALGYSCLSTLCQMLLSL